MKIKKIILFILILFLIFFLWNLKSPCLERPFGKTCLCMGVKVFNDRCLGFRTTAFVDPGPEFFEEFEETKTPPLTPVTSDQKDLPTVPGANILISVIDEQGQKVNQGAIKMLVKHEGKNSYYDYDYSVNLNSINNGLLGLHPSPNRYPATISIWIETVDSRKSDTLLINNVEYWQAVEQATKDYVASHQFDLNKSGEISRVVYD